MAAIARHVGLSWSATKQHLRELETEGLVTSKLVARRRIYALDGAHQARRALVPDAARRIARVVLGSNGVTVKEAARRASVSLRVAYHHAARFRALDLVRAYGEPMRLHATAKLHALIE